MGAGEGEKGAHGTVRILETGDIALMHHGLSVFVVRRLHISSSKEL